MARKQSVMSDSGKRWERIVAQIQEQTSHSKRLWDETLNLSKERIRVRGRFFHACEYGDAQTVGEIIQDPKFDCNRSDYLGRTGIQVAVQNEHQEIVSMLINRCSVSILYESLLQAIRLNKVNISELFITDERYEIIAAEGHRRVEAIADQKKVRRGKSYFSPEVTPILLAAQQNNFDLVQLLLLKGEKINRPHKYSCTCETCRERHQHDLVGLANERLNIYRGLASEAYISLTSPDPILEAIKLGDLLRRNSRYEKYFMAEYQALAANLSEYVVKLLEQTRDSFELDAVLDKTDEDDLSGFERLSRLELAVNFGEKKFVAHPLCQQKLIATWYGRYRELKYMSFSKNLLLTLAFAVVYPFLAVLSCILPKHLMGKRLQHFLSIPFLKFMASSSCFGVFIILIFLVSIQTGSHGHTRFYPELHQHYTRSTWPATGVAFSGNDPNFIPVWIHEKPFQLRLERLRGSQLSVLQIVFYVWVIGMMFQEVKELYRKGIADYFAYIYNYIDAGMMMCYFTSFILNIFVHYQVAGSIDAFKHEESWKKLRSGDEDFGKMFYWLTADRRFWNPWDPVFVAEGMFACGNLLTLARVSSLLPASNTFGPMQISLIRMISDVMTFLGIFTMVFLAFMLALFNLYDGYWVAPDWEGEFNGVAAFGSLPRACATMFWAMFGMSEASSTELHFYQDKEVVGYSTFQGVPCEAVTETLGLLLFAIYHIIMVVVLLNMLIAMMSRSYEEIVDSADEEWKFSRTRLFLDYIPSVSGLSTLVPPFNLLPSPVRLCDAVSSWWENTCNKSSEVEYEQIPIVLKNVYPTFQGWPIKTVYHYVKKYESRSQTFDMAELEAKMKTQTSTEIEESTVTHKCETIPEHTNQHQGGVEEVIKSESYAEAAHIPAFHEEMERLRTESEDEKEPLTEDDADSGALSDSSSVSDDDSIENGLKYQKVMHQLIRRFIFSSQHGDDNENLTAADLEELKQDLSSFRYEVLHLLRGSSTTQSPAKELKVRVPTAEARIKRSGSASSLLKLEPDKNELPPSFGRDDNFHEGLRQSLRKRSISQGRSRSPSLSHISAQLIQTCETSTEKPGNSASTQTKDERVYPWHLEADIYAPKSDQNTQPETRRLLQQFDEQLAGICDAKVDAESGDESASFTSMEM